LDLSIPTTTPRTLTFFPFQNAIMVKEVNAETLKIVLDSWADLKKMEDYDKVSGLKVMKL